MFITVIQNKYPHFEIQLPLQCLGTDEVCLASELLLLAKEQDMLQEACPCVSMNSFCLKATHSYIYFVQMKTRGCQLDSTGPKMPSILKT